MSDIDRKTIWDVDLGVVFAAVWEGQREVLERLPYALKATSLRSTSRVSASSSLNLEGSHYLFHTGPE